MFKIFKQILRHKLITFIIIAIIVTGSYFVYQRLTKDKSMVRYVTATIERGTLISSVSGSGQVSAFNQVDIKPKVSGDVVYVGVKKDQEVKTGTILVQLDTADAQKAVRDAETSLETTQLESDELLKPVDELTLLQAENSLTQLKESKQKAEDNLVKAYEDGYNAIVSAFFDLPGIMSDMDNILYSDTINKYQDNIDAYSDMVRAYDEKVVQYRNDVATSYQAARTAYDKNFQNYKAVSRYSDSAIIEVLIDETYEAAKKIAEAIRSTDNLISFVKDIFAQRKLNMPAITSTHQSNVRTHTSKTNSIISNLLSIKSTIKSSRDAIISIERSIEEKELSLAKLKAGPDELTIRAKKIAIQQKEDALATAKQKLADYFISAPFAGIVAKMDIKKGDSVSTNTVIATLITKQRIAEISLNEIDAAEVKVDQKATLTFDALPDLSVSGKVLEIDTVGTVSQGVVSYGVKIAFDTEEEAVMPGMSVTVSIITDVKQNVVLAPNSAVKSQNNAHYVEIMADPEGKPSASYGAGNNIPRPQAVEIGISNDTMTEIVSGLKEGDIVVTSTSSSSAAQTTKTQGTQGFQIPGMGTQMRFR